MLHGIDSMRKSPIHMRKSFSEPQSEVSLASPAGAIGMSGCSGGTIVQSVGLLLGGSSSGGVSGCSVSRVGFWPAELEAILCVDAYSLPLLWV
ncbi:hypothetical protein RRG08_027921 [Elysia crispata]|uniref:Uncharacterized protein n=1 Tax=Elysia crispata TaxID=231223 RepID=A0AAE1A7D9_9GAST|nr:hypothetical protein RRG08_027921 [Elysia crispata]